MQPTFASQFIQYLLLTFQILAIFILPQVFVILSKRNKIFKFLSPVLLCYLAGIIFANIPIPALWDKNLSMTISEISVPIAIALILFSADLVKWSHLIKMTKSFFLVLVSATIATSVMAMIYSGWVDEGWKIAGMLTGCYTGGTPNLMAVGTSLKVPKPTIALVNMCDMLCGGVYFLLISSFLIKVYRRFLPKYESSDFDKLGHTKIMALETIFDDGVLQGWKNIGFALLFAILATGVSVGIALLFTGEMNTLIIILSVTTISIALSFWKKLKSLRGTNAMGQYAVYIFSMAIGGAVDISKFFESSPLLLGYTASIMMSGILLHFILCKIFKVDADTAIITSMAGVYGPAFIAPVAEAMNNKEIVVSGLLTGIVGYAVGNYLGIAIAYLTKMLFYI